MEPRWRRGGLRAGGLRRQFRISGVLSMVVNARLSARDAGLKLVGHRGCLACGAAPDTGARRHNVIAAWGILEMASGSSNGGSDSGCGDATFTQQKVHLRAGTVTPSRSCYGGAANRAPGVWWLSVRSGKP